MSVSASLSGMVHHPRGHLHGICVLVPYLPPSLPQAHPLPHGLLHHPPWCACLPVLCHGDAMETKTEGVR